ncbi:MAG: S8 family peptidase [Candidatus Sericytochromatia bacterium]|nr:S8 family peptidase [Candidatus Sericytochromatia bacterium]
MTRPLSFTALLAAFTLSACAPALAPAAPPREAPAGLTAQARARELLIGHTRGQGAALRASLSNQWGLAVVDAIPALDVVVVKAPTDLAGTLSRLRRAPGVRFVEANAVETLPALQREPLLLTPRPTADDPLSEQQWGLEKARVREAWRITRGSRDTRIAIIDTGIDYTHPDLADHVVKGPDFVNGDDDPMDDNTHGTHCAGIAGASAENGIGVAGVAPGATLMAVKVMDKQGTGEVANICKGIVWAADQGAHVISVSLGGRGGPEAKQAAVDYARSKGALVVAAMGNDGQFLAFYPAANKGVFAVGATTQQDTRADFSNMGVWMSVTAPGHKILSTVLRGGYWALSGTSMATPHVAGLAALVKSRKPDMTAEAIAQQIRRHAQDLGKPGFDEEYGHGRIDAERTLAGL